MLRIESTDEGVRIQTSGSVPEILKELTLALREIRNAFSKTDDGDVFDFYLQDVLIPIIFMENHEEMERIFAESIMKRCMNDDETEHKQD